MTEPAKRYCRSRTDRVLTGVCGGLAKYLAIDPVLVRIGWALITIATGGLGILAYVLLWLLAPLEPDAAAAPQPGST